MTEPTAGFRDPARLTNWTQALLYASLAVPLVSMYMGVAELLAHDDSWWERSLGRLQDLFNPLGLFLEVMWRFGANLVAAGAAVAVLLWIHRANSNARALGATNMKFTPGWAVGWYFVPVAWFWKPYQAMREIWQASADPANWERQWAPPLLGWWWALWIVPFWILDAVSWAVTRGMEEAQAGRVESLFGVAINVLDIPLTLVFLAIVGRVHRMQMERWRSQDEEAAAPA